MNAGKENDMSENLKVYTVDDLTEMLGTSKNAVYCLLKKNYFRSIKIGGLYRIPKKGFDDWLEGKPEDGAQEVFETEVEDPLADDRYLDGIDPGRDQPVTEQKTAQEKSQDRQQDWQQSQHQNQPQDLQRNQQQTQQQAQQQSPQKKDLSQMTADERMKEFMDAWEKSSDQPAKKPKCL